MPTYIMYKLEIIRNKEKIKTALSTFTNFQEKATLENFYQNSKTLLAALGALLFR